MEGGDYSRHEAYWMEALRGPLPTLALPTDFPRPEVQTFEGDRTSIQLEASCLHRLKERAAERGATLHMALLAAYALLLNHYGGGRNDLIVGTPSAGRIEPDLEPVIGMFVQTLPIRCRPSDRLPFEKFLQEVKEQTLAAYECQAYPLEELPMKLGLPRDVSRNPLFDTVFVLQNHAKAEWSSGRLHAEPIPFRPPTAKFDLTLEAAETDSGLTLTLEYAAKLFRRETAIRLLADYVRLLRAIASDPCVELRNLEWSPVISGGAEKLFADADFNL
jgi:non-ribosomal peptide synthetase component F